MVPHFPSIKVLEQIKNHPFIKTNLSAMELEWSLANLKTIYTKGWNFWIVQSLVQKGIGIRKLNFDHGVALANEETCIYWLKNWINEWHHKRQRFEGAYNFSDDQSLWSDTRKFLMHMGLTKLDGKGSDLSKYMYDAIKLCELCEKNNFDRLLHLVLDNFGKQMTSRNYFDRLKLTHKKKK